MLVMLAAVSALIGVAVTNGRSALLPFTILMALAYLVARRSQARPSLVAASAALPAIAIAIAFSRVALVDAWPFHLAALVVLTGLAWLIAQRAHARP